MRVEVEAVHQVTDELVDVAGRLLPQLSRSATPLDADGLARIVGHQAITLFIARSGGVIVGMLTLVAFPSPPDCGHESRMWLSTRTPAVKASAPP